jgi:hypothetical protein
MEAFPELSVVIWRVRIFSLLSGYLTSVHRKEPRDKVLERGNKRKE